MKIKLVFLDWYNIQGESVYNSEKGIELSAGDFHSGSTFAADIDLDIESTQELQDALTSGYIPVLHAVYGDPEFRWKKANLTEIDEQAMAGLACAKECVDTKPLLAFIEILELMYREASQQYLRLAAGLKALKTASKKQTCLQLEGYMERLKNEARVREMLKNFEGNGERGEYDA